MTLVRFFACQFVAINTRFTDRCISVRSYGYSLKATFIHKNNGKALLRKAIRLILYIALFIALFIGQVFGCYKVFFLTESKTL